MANFVLPTPSLQHLAAVKAVAALWSHHAVLLIQIQEITAGTFDEVTKKWFPIEQRVKTKVSTLKLTEPCKRQLLQFIGPMGMEIYAWCCYHYLDSDENVLKCSLPKRFYWTMQGTVDYARMAELMVKDESLDVVRRYEIACINCLEDEARQLIRFVPEERRRAYMRRMIHTKSDQHPDLLVFFTCTLSCDVDELNRAFRLIVPNDFSITAYLCFRSLFVCNRVTSDYFFNKLNHPEMKELIVGGMASAVVDKFALKPRCKLLYYLSLMNEEQREGLFRTCIGNVLVCLLRWPMQSLFSEAVKCGWRYMAHGDYEKVLSVIADKISDGIDYQDYDYSQLFWECWSLTPADVRRHLLDSEKFLDNLLEARSAEFFRLILNKAPCLQILALINNFHDRCQMLTYEIVISDAALMECKETAAMKSSNDEDDAEKRLRSELVSRFIDLVMESRVTT